MCFAGYIVSDKSQNLVLYTFFACFAEMNVDDVISRAYPLRYGLVIIGVWFLCYNTFHMLLLF